MTAQATLNAMLTQLKTEKFMVVELYLGDPKVYITTHKGSDLISAIQTYIKAMDLEIDFAETLHHIKKEVLENYK